MGVVHTNINGGLTEALRQRAVVGLEQRLAEKGPDAFDRAAYSSRLDLELAEVERRHLADFFLEAARVVERAHDDGIPVGPGRGSAAGSLLLFALGVTQIDPLAFGLLFERFLIPDREPYIEIDLGPALLERRAVEHLPIARRPGTVVRWGGWKSKREPGTGALMTLGLPDLDVIHAGFALARERGRDVPDPRTIPLDDPETLALIRRGDTDGVFHLDDESIRGVLALIEPATFEHVAAAIALRRPIPTRTGLLEAYVARRHGRGPCRGTHEALAPILGGTYGLLLYHEQSERVLVATGVAPDLFAAERVRRFLGRGHPADDELHGALLAGARRLGVDEEDARDLLKWIRGHSTFLRAHAVAYGTIAFRAAWLKAHHPECFDEARGAYS